jgi:hypothetical protein
VCRSIGKYDMWYGVVCKTVMSSCMSTGGSLGGGRDTESCLGITANSLITSMSPIVVYYY